MVVLYYLDSRLSALIFVLVGVNVMLLFCFAGRFGGLRAVGQRRQRRQGPLAVQVLLQVSVSTHTHTCPLTRAPTTRRHTRDKIVCVHFLTRCVWFQSQSYAQLCGLKILCGHLNYEDSSCFLSVTHHSPADHTSTNIKAS